MRRGAKRREMHAYGAVPLRALRDEELCPGALRVLTAIAAHDGGGRGCTASNARLGWMARCAERSVSRHISTLTKSNYIRDDGGADGRQRSRYRCLKVVRTPADDAVARGQDASDGGKQTGSVEIHRDTPE